MNISELSYQEISIQSCLSEAETAMVPGFPEYFFTADGKIFKNGISKKVSCKKGRSAKIVIRQNNKMHTFGFAKLIAQAFIPNPNNHTQIAFKDGNHHRCCKENIEWIAPKISPAKKVKSIPSEILNMDMTWKELNTSPGYFLSACGKLFHKGKLKHSFFKKCVKVNIGNKEYSLGKLLAVYFIPNPENHRLIIYLDKNPKNCVIENIKWVSNIEYMSHTLGKKWFRVATQNPPINIKKLRPKKETKISLNKQIPIVQNVEIVELVNEDLAGYYITSDGRAFRGGRPISVRKKQNKPPVLRVQKRSKRYSFSLARLVATYFVVNPRRYKHIIFKDYNNGNCSANNLIWVSGDVFFEYCCGAVWRSGRKKLQFDKEYAIENCKDPDLQAYYKTLDETWLETCWKKIDAGYQRFCWWPSVQSECYMYFLDRVKRNSIIAPAKAMIWYFAKGQRIKLQEEISPDIPYGKLKATDESMRRSKYKIHSGIDCCESW